MDSERKRRRERKRNKSQVSVYLYQLSKWNSAALYRDNQECQLYFRWERAAVSGSGRASPLLLLLLPAFFKIVLSSLIASRFFDVPRTAPPVDLVPQMNARADPYSSPFSKRSQLKKIVCANENSLFVISCSGVPPMPFVQLQILHWCYN